MKTVRLGAIAESLPCDYGDDPTDDAPAFHVVKVSNVGSEGQFHGDFEKRRFRDDQIANLLVKEGELLVVKSSGSKANILSGKTAICGTDRAGRIVASNFLLRLRVDEAAAVPRFLWYVLNSGASKAFVKTIVGASTYPNLKWSLYASHPVALPPLAEQRRIVEVLDRAEALRAKRRAALAQLDSLTQSLFLDLFGDPATNPKGWPRKPIGEIGKVITGNTPPRANPGYYGTHIEWIKSDNINTPHYYLTKASEGLSESGKAVARTVPAGSILVTCIAGSPECIGNAAMTDREVAFNQQINAFVPANGDPHFLYAQMLVGKRLIQEASTAGMKGMVSKGRFERIFLVLPPIELQREFACRVTAVEKLKTAQRASLAEFDALFASLQHRAFRGEL